MLDSLFDYSYYLPSVHEKCKTTKMEEKDAKKDHLVGGIFPSGPSHAAGRRSQGKYD
jgi:hypothetical protein